MKKSGSALPVSTNPKTELELKLENLALEREKLRLEWFKAWWTGFSILIPLLIAAATLYFNGRTQLEQARIDFKLKAAEIVLNTSGPSEAKNKAEALVNLFPAELPANFADNFAPTDYGSPKISTQQKELLNLIIAHPEQRNEIVEMWLAVAPFDTWAEKLKK